MESKPDVQLGKIFIVLWIGFMLFIIISIVVVYFNAKNEASNCEPSENKLDSSKKPSSTSRTTKLFIAFLAITAFAVSTMNLTYKINYFSKKPEEQPPSATNLLGMIQKLKNNQTAGPPLVASAPLLNNESLLVASAPPESNTESNN